MDLAPFFFNWTDIHSVAKDIASINSVDLQKIRNILLEKWLCQTGQSNGKVCKIYHTLQILQSFERQTLLFAIVVQQIPSVT